MSQVPMSATRKVYFARLFGRILILLACVYQYFRDKSAFDVAFGTGFFQKPSLLHLLWGLWLVDMLHQLIPARGYISLGSQKHFLRRFKPITEKINLRDLHRHIVTATRAAYHVMLIWVAFIGLIAWAYFAGLLDRAALFVIAVAFYVCDLICVLIWCPFRLVLKNKCCTTCRIFNWDHLMMFSPFILVPGVYTSSLLAMSILVFLVWELCIYLHPERFWEFSNRALQCSECTEKLCTQYCQKLRKR